MIVTINLLPPELKLKRIQSKQNAHIFSLCFIAISIVILICLALFSYMTTLKYNLQSVKDSIASAKTQIARYQDLEKDVDQIAQAIDYTRTLDAQSFDWNNFFSQFSSLVPQNVQVTSFQVAAGSSSTLDLAGQSSSRREALKLYEKLKISPLFSKVTLLSLAKSETDKKTQIIFTINAEVRKESKP